MIFTLDQAHGLSVYCTAAESLALDNKSQNLHRNDSISVEGGFEQAPETDVRHYRTCCSSLCVRSWSGKPMHGQYRRLTEQSPVDMKETYG